MNRFMNMVEKVLPGDGAAQAKAIAQSCMAPKETLHAKNLLQLRCLLMPGGTSMDHALQSCRRAHSRSSHNCLL